MKGVKRLHIDIDWEKLKELHPKAEVKCMQKKWDPFKKWEQGFDSDCFAHCSNYEHCTSAFYDNRVENKNHFKEIIVPTEEKLFWGDKEVNIENIK